MVDVAFGLPLGTTKHFVILATMELDGRSPIRVLTDECDRHAIRIICNGVLAVTEGSRMRGPDGMPLPQEDDEDDDYDDLS